MSRGKGTVFFMIVLLGVGVRGALAGTMSPAEHQELGDALYSRGMYRLAADEYTAVLTGDPHYTNAAAVLLRLAECRRESGDRRGAAAAYERLVHQFPDAPEADRARIRWAELLIRDGKNDAALDLLDKVLARRSAGELAEAAHYRHACALARAGRKAEAERELRALIEGAGGSPYFAAACLELARILKDKGVVGTEVSGLYSQACERAASPRLAAEALFQKAHEEYLAKEYAAAAADYRRLLEKYPTDERSRQARLEAGWALYHDGRYADALDLCRKTEAGERQAADGEWLYLEANCERQLLDGKAALKSYSRLLRAYPSGKLAAAARYEKALLLFEEEKYREVTEVLEGGGVPPGVEADAFWMLGESWAKLGEGDHAMQYYRKVCDEHPHGIHAPAALYRIGLELQRRGNFAQAAEYFERLASGYTNDTLAAEALWQAGRCRVAAGDVEQGAVQWRELARRYPTNELAGTALLHAGMAELDLGRAGKAREVLEQAVGFGSGAELVKILYWLGVSCERLEDFECAADAYGRALDEHPGREASGRLRMRLAGVWFRLGRDREAAELIHDLAAESPPPVRLDFTLVRKSVLAFSANGEHEKAVETASALVEVASNAFQRQEAYYLRGSAEREGGDAAAALEDFQKALSTKASTRAGAEAALAAAEISFRDKRYDEAVEYYSRAGEMAAGDGNIDIRARSYYGLARCADARGDLQAALRYYMGVGLLFDDERIVPESLYRAAEDCRRLDRPEQARKLLDELRRRYPNSKWARRKDAAGGGESGRENNQTLKGSVDER